MPPGFSGNLIFAIIARMLCGNHLNFVCDELLHTTSLLLATECITLQNSDAKLFATVVAVKHGVGGSRF